MAYTFVQDVPIKRDVYSKIMEKLGSTPPSGLICHLVLENNDGTLRYVDVWESKEACDRAFEERIHPAVFSVFEEIGFRPQGEPKREVAELVHAWIPKG